MEQEEVTCLSCGIIENKKEAPFWINGYNDMHICNSCYEHDSRILKTFWDLSDEVDITDEQLGRFVRLKVRQWMDECEGADDLAAYDEWFDEEEVKNALRKDAEASRAPPTSEDAGIRTEDTL